MESINSLYYQYEDGEEMKQIWNPAFVIFAYIIAFLSSYSAVHLLDHGLWFWRSEELKRVAIIKYPDIIAACMIGFGTVWCMHFVGMAAVTLEGAAICYNWGITMGSLVAVVVLIIAGIKVAGNDIFATPDRDEILDQILRDEYVSNREQADKLRIISSHKLQYLAFGSFLAASGAIIMHYTGMMAQRGPFRKEWNVAFIAASVITAIVICFVGFWIIFRLRWKIQQLWLRIVSAAVIALAFCGLHFFGMLSVTYYADNNSIDICQDTWDKSSTSPNAWTNHQVIVLALGLAVIGSALLIECVINQELIMAYEFAAKSSEIVTSLFPPQVRDRLFAGGKHQLRNFLTGECSETSKLSGDEEDVDTFQSKPIADLFTETTVMFADIAGFTAWSSQREPSQIFTLLEKIYGAFDEISHRREVWKVETVGDCYVAVSGLPNPRKDHAVAMCHAARDCLNRMGGLTKKLEVALGPGTADLKLRVGLHSGPVIAGVLRGDRARFQLFGDTMNLASRMETTGLAGHIQVSTETANLLKESGKECWVTPREELVVAKGKGELKTYWLLPDQQDTASNYSGVHSSVGEASGKRDRLISDISPSFSPKIRRIIEWHVESLSRLLKNIAARRKVGVSVVHLFDSSQRREDGSTVLDEVQDYIALPEIDFKSAKKCVAPESIELDESVKFELYEYVSALAAMYRGNPFHNFEHASHVTMSVSKLLSRIVAPADMEQMQFRSTMDMNQTLHDYTYGITSDPLTQFACVLSGLIHDVDHTGVPNTQLVKENPSQATYYKGRSVAEQNSVDLAWNLLMEDQYSNLRSAIYTTQEDFRRFRQLVVNCVMATDIMDKELKALRNARWEKAFSECAHAEDPRATINRKATIVIEHLIQASDVAHTMQHWHVYTMWNERLFQEMMLAWKSGRADRNPAEFWYKGEIGFFDFYIIPLAKKLKECGVFGVSSDEYLNYAVSNRMEWEKRGKQVVEEMIKKFSDTPPELLPAESTKPTAKKAIEVQPTTETEQKQQVQLGSLREEIKQLQGLLTEKLKLEADILAKQEFQC